MHGIRPSCLCVEKVSRGHVVSRTGDTLVVKGGFLVRPDRDAHFHRTVIVELGPNTTVFKIADRDQLLDKDAISIGQRIIAPGKIRNKRPVVTSNPTAAKMPKCRTGMIWLTINEPSNTG